MSKKKEHVNKRREPSWKHDPDDHDFPAAMDYLALLVGEKEIDEVVDKMKRASTEFKHAKDILRASGLPELPSSNRHVASDLEKIKANVELSPILLVRGDAEAGVPLVIADGYHRVCAVYSIDENAEVPCRVASFSRDPVTESRSSKG